MYVYAGIDEAGYGPLFGPLVIGRMVLGIPNLPPGGPGDPPPALWQRLCKAVCRDLTRRQGRIAVNDSKKLYTPAAGLRHLETGVLTFAALAGRRPADLGQLLESLGETAQRDLAATPWYAADASRPWQALPTSITGGELAVARNLLDTTARRIGVQALDLGAAVVFEDRFNRMVAVTRSKASVSFTFVARHLRHVWEAYGQHQPTVVVDRQSGRMRYREALATAVPEAEIQVCRESPECSEYRLREPHSGRGMVVSFPVEAERQHMPAALASMIAKYLRELLMARFQAWWTARCPDIAPTAGYAGDGLRFWSQVQPRLAALGVAAEALRRQA